MSMQNPYRQSSRKHAFYAVFLDDGLDAMRAHNATLTNPVKETTLRSWHSTWSNEQENSTRISLTPALREAAIRLSGAVRIANRAQIYRLPDGTVAKLRTNKDCAFMAADDSEFRPGSTDTTIQAALFAIPRTRRTLEDGIDVYLIPTSVLRDTIAITRQAWLDTNPDTNGNELDIFHFDRRPDRSEAGQDFATKWARYLIGSESESAAAPAPTVPASGAGVRLVEYRGYRVVSDQEILSAPTADGLVTMLRLGARFVEPDPDNTTFMRGVAHRSRITGGNPIRTDTPQNFLRDMHDEGMITLIKREYMMDAA